jgi:hypothetical protein
MLPDLLLSQRLVEARMKAVLSWAEEKQMRASASPQERRLCSTLGYLETVRLRFRARHGRPRPESPRLTLATRAPALGR